MGKEPRRVQRDGSGHALELDALLAVLDLVHRLRRAGWRGAVGASLAGLLLVLSGGALLYLTGPWDDGRQVWHPFWTLISTVIMAGAVPCFLVALEALRAPPPPARPGREEALAALRAANKPVLVCVRCRWILEAFSAPQCPLCEATSSVVEVTSEAQIPTIAAAWIEEPPAPR